MMFTSYRRTIYFVPINTKRTITVSHPRVSLKGAWSPRLVTSHNGQLRIYREIDLSRACIAATWVVCGERTSGSRTELDFVLCFLLFSILRTPLLPKSRHLGCKDKQTFQSTETSTPFSLLKVLSSLFKLLQGTRRMFFEYYVSSQSILAYKNHQPFKPYQIHWKTL